MPYVGAGERLPSARGGVFRGRQGLPGDGTVRRSFVDGVAPSHDAGGRGPPVGNGRPTASEKKSERVNAGHGSAAVEGSVAAARPDVGSSHGHRGGLCSSIWPLSPRQGGNLIFCIGSDTKRRIAP